MKLWDVWLYEEDLGLPLAPPDEERAAQRPARGATAEAVAARVIKADLLATMEGCDPVRWAVAIREHGSGQPFRLFQGIAHLTFRVTLGEVSVAEPAWG
ncbi:MAG: hypothetical protein U0931_33205 [Vulcanimicrobiota bacterium]